MFGTMSTNTYFYFRQKLLFTVDNSMKYVINYKRPLLESNSRYNILIYNSISLKNGLKLFYEKKKDIL